MSFSLPNYYRLCDEIVAALEKHETLLSTHFNSLTPEHYDDRSLHLLAFDLMYCCRTYNFYRGLTVPSTGKTVRKKSGPQTITPEEIAKREAERLAKIASLEDQIADLERRCAEYSDISLIGVQVKTAANGIGTVIEQNINRIKVRFAEVEKSFILDKKFSARPRFEDDEKIISAFTEYGQAQEQINRLQRELAVLQG